MLTNLFGSTTTLAHPFQRGQGVTGWLLEGVRPVRKSVLGPGNWASCVNIQHGATGGLVSTGSVNFLNMDKVDGCSHRFPQGNVGFAQEIDGGEWLIGVDRSLLVLNPKTGETRQTGISFDGNAITDKVPMVINDAHVFADAAGTPIGLLVTTKSKDFGCQGGYQGRIYFFRFADKQLFMLYDGFVCVNTPVVRRKTTKGYELFLVETRYGVIYKTDFNPFANSADQMVKPTSELEVFVDFANRGWEGFPDGQWLSGDGKYLVGAAFNPGSAADGLTTLPGRRGQHKGFRDTSLGVIRAIDLLTTRVVHTWEVPGSCRVTCSAPVMMEKGPRLLITTADEGMPGSQQELNPYRGSLFIAELPKDLVLPTFPLIPAEVFAV